MRSRGVILVGLACADLPPDKEALDWNTRMKIAAGAARGLEYLHDKANPPVIYRDFKSSNILLDDGFHPKLSDFGLAKLGPVGDKTHVSTRVMGTYGYCAPEYAMTGQLTLKSDVYSFGVVLLELITGRKAIDNARAAGEHNLVAWVDLSTWFMRPSKSSSGLFWFSWIRLLRANVLHSYNSSNLVVGWVCNQSPWVIVESVVMGSQNNMCSFWYSS